MWGLLWTETAGVLKIHRAFYSHFVISDLPCRHSGLFDATADRRGTGIRGNSRMCDLFFKTPAVFILRKPHIDLDCGRAVVNLKSFSHYFY